MSKLYCNNSREFFLGDSIYRVIKTLCAPDDCSTKTRKNILNSFSHHDGVFRNRDNGVSVSLVSVNVWRLAGDTLNITCNFLYCNHQVHRDFLITLYNLCTDDVSLIARHIHSLI
jgi:hypothetical protein